MRFPRRQVRSFTRVGLSLLLCVAAQLAAPPPAHAWFGWLDKFSGPGDFVGLLVEARLFCFGEDIGLTDLRLRIVKAEMLTGRLILGQQKVLDDEAVIQQLRETQSAWLDVVVAVEEVQRRFPVIQQTTLDAARSIANHSFLGAPPDEAGTPIGGAATPATVEQKQAAADRRAAMKTIAEDAESFRTEARLAIGAAERQAQGASRSQNGSGTFWSTCDPEKRRRVSVELNLDMWRSLRSHSNLAADEQVRFTTAMPSITYRVFVDPTHDVLDVGAGAGLYWFSSKGFDSFRGSVVEPIRLSVHAPSTWHTRPFSDPRRLLAALGVRGALLLVPRGFGAEVFKGTGAKAARIPTELVPSVGIFLNVNSLFRGPH